MLGLDSGALPLGIDELLQRTEALLLDALRQQVSRNLPAAAVPRRLRPSSAIRSHHDLA